MGRRTNATQHGSLGDAVDAWGKRKLMGDEEGLRL